MNCLHDQSYLHGTLKISNYASNFRFKMTIESFMQNSMLVRFGYRSITGLST